MSDNTNKFIRIVLLLIIALAVVVFLVAISNIVKLIIIAALLAYVLDPVASFFESRGMSRTTATVSIFIFRPTA